MGSRALLGLALSALLPAAAPAQTQQPGVVRLPWSQWQMHIGGGLQCAQIEAPSCSGPPVVFPDHSNPDQWQRTEVELPAELQSKPELGILVQGEIPVYEVFVNGRRIGGSGSFATDSGPQDARSIFPIPASLPRRGRLTIAIHTLGVNSSSHVDAPVPTIAALDELQLVKDADTLSYLRMSWLHYLCFGAMFGIGVVFFLLFSVNTRAHEYFWLGARLCELLMFRLCELASVVDMAMPSGLTLAMNSFFNMISPIILVEFIFAFLGRPVTKFFRLVEIAGLLNGSLLAAQLFRGTPLYIPVARFADSVYIHHPGIAAILLAALSLFLLAPVCFKSPLPEMRWIGAASLFFVVEESNRMAGFIDLPSIPQDFFWRGLDIDLRGISNLLFASVMLVAMTFRLRRIQDRNRQVEQEMAAARSVQQVLIPEQLPSIPGLRIESAYLPAQEVGGDFFQILPVPNSANPERPSAFIVLGDVSGKGLKAAMTVSLIVGALRTYAETCTSPGELLAGLNRRLHGRGDGFATCLALMVAPSGKMTLANAGHPNPYLNGVEIPTEANLPLGLAQKVHYSDIELQLPPGQICTLVTDGVVEATNATTRELFGFERTQAASNQSATDIAEAARAFGMGAPQADDITVLTIARAGVLSAVPA
jgi:hypothetical protein